MSKSRWHPFSPGFRWPIRLLGIYFIVGAIVSLSTSNTIAALFCLVLGVGFVTLSYIRLEQRTVGPPDAAGRKPRP